MTATVVAPEGGSAPSSDSERPDPPRVIPILLLDRRRMVKTTAFRDPVYVGDPINVVRILNEKEVDELCVLDIGAPTGTGPDLEYVAELASESFAPLTYGGGIRSYDDAAAVLALGVEKIALQRAFFDAPSVAERVAAVHGGQCVVASIDYRSTRDGARTLIARRGQVLASTPQHAARRAVDAGAGEILLTSVDREGSGCGYDLDVLASVVGAVDVPVICNGGAASLEHFQAARHAGASALGAGTMFVFYGPHRAVLVTYPRRSDLDRIDA